MHWSKHSQYCSAQVPEPYQDNEDMKYILSVFKYKLYILNQLSEPTVNDVKRKCERSQLVSCRWKIAKEFMSEALDDADLVFTFQHKIPPNQWVEQGVFYDAFAIVKLLPSKDGRKSAYLHLICSRNLYVDDRKLRTSLGLILHGFVIDYLNKNGYDDIYLEASNLEIVPYYTWLGYEPSGESCSTRTSFFGKMEQLLFGKTEKAEMGKHGGWKMRMCGIGNSKIYNLVESHIEKSAEELRSAIVDEASKTMLYVDI
jgi:hypothetical protein